MVATVPLRESRSVSRELQHSGYKREADFVEMDCPPVTGRQIGVVLHAQHHPVLPSAKAVMLACPTDWREPVEALSDN